MSVTPEVFVLKTSNFKDKHLCTLCISINNNFSKTDKKHVCKAAAENRPTCRVC